MSTAYMHSCLNINENVLQNLHNNLVSNLCTKYNLLFCSLGSLGRFGGARMKAGVDTPWDAARIGGGCSSSLIHEDSQEGRGGVG